MLSCLSKEGTVGIYLRSGAAVGSAVAHAKFGTGKVIELSSGYVTVSFGQGKKRFLFPNAFESGFLKAQ